MRCFCFAQTNAKGSGPSPLQNGPAEIGRERVLACGRPYVGPLKGPLTAYRLDVPKRTVEPDEPPRPLLLPEAPLLAFFVPAFPDAPPLEPFFEAFFANDLRVDFFVAAELPDFRVDFLPLDVLVDALDLEGEYVLQRVLGPLEAVTDLVQR